jgi:hypothetical protein
MVEKTPNARRLRGKPMSFNNDTTIVLHPNLKPKYFWDQVFWAANYVDKADLQIYCNEELTDLRTEDNAQTFLAGLLLAHALIRD